MLSREQVLHVARLARLELSEDELERLGGELSKVVDWIDTIGEVGDISEVPPTSHVVEIENRLREDVPRPCLPREEALAGAPATDGEGFLVPSPGAGSEMDA
jgi:aspartyl-tRNA(Asn)/glutamyl-tRNA(Gln) amidotransferase subunit C